jgi:HlyD family secretion protein/epimerase transport system membrane fusion protein
MNPILERLGALWSDGAALLTSWSATAGAAAAPLRERPDVVVAVLLAGVAVALIVFGGRRRARRDRRGARRRAPPAPALRAVTRPQRRVAALVLLVFFGVGGTWAAMAELSSAAVAPGIIGPEGRRRTVQHLEGGIIREFHVRTGTVVEAGAPLVTLQDIGAISEFRILRDRYLALLAQEARLVAGEREATAIGWPVELRDWLAHARNDDAVGPPRPEGRVATIAATVGAVAFDGVEDDIVRLIESQTRLFRSNREQRESVQDILAQRIAQLRSENDGLRGAVASFERQEALIRSELADVRALVERGLARRPRLLALQRRMAQIEGERAQSLARIARNEQAIGETRLQAINARQAEMESIARELARTREELAEIRARLPSAADKLRRTVVTAPVDGTVVDLRFSTEGGVVGAGEPILDLVPADEDLVIEARVRPRDIDTVHPGLEARVLLTAYPQRNLPLIHGEVRQVTADRLVDERTGDAYYVAEVIIDQDELERLDGSVDEPVTLVSGMPVEIMIVTGQRTFLDYLFQPIADSLRRGLRES